jgi:hypothetical protein
MLSGVLTGYTDIFIDFLISQNCLIAYRDALGKSSTNGPVLKALSANRYPAELSALGHIQYDADTNHSIVANIIIHLTVSRPILPAR